MRYSTVLGVLCGCVVGLTGLPLFAQSGPPVGSSGETTEMGDKARELFLDGQKAMAKGHWGEAHAAFLAAWGLKKQYEIAGNLGSMEMRLKQYRDAAEHLAFYIRDAPKEKEKERLKAQALLAEARTHVGALTIKVEPAGAEVLVDRVLVGRTPLGKEVFVDPGARSIEATLAGYEAVQVTVELKAGEAREVPITLMKKEASSGTAKADSTGAKRTGREPTAGGAGGASGAAMMGETAAEGGPRKAVIIAGIASSAVMVSGGVVFAIVSSVNASDAADRRTALLQGNGGKDPCLISPLPAGCKEFESSLAAKGTFGNLSVFSFVLGGALGAGTAIYAVATPKPKPAGVVRVVPIVSAEAAGLVLRGRW